MTLQQILSEYVATLCNKRFVYELIGGQIIKVTFYKEHLCHLLGIQHVYNDKKYIGAAGFQRILDGDLTIKDMRNHDQKQYNFVKEKISHFHELEQLMLNCSCFRFYSDRCDPRTSISADFLLHKDNTEYMLHLFLRREQIGKDLFSPVSFVVKNGGDKAYDQFVKRQEYKQVIRVNRVCIDEQSAS